MSNNVFYDGLNEFCRKYLILGDEPTGTELANFPLAQREVFSTVFEHLLIFDKVSLKVFGENVPLALLLNLFGDRGFDELVEQDAIDFVLWTPMILFPEKHIEGLDPIFAGNQNSEAHCDPEKSIELGLSWMQQKPSRARRRSLVRKLRDRYRLPDKDLPHDAVKVTKSAYVSGKLDGYGFESEQRDIRKLAHSERKRLTDCATDLLEYNYLLSNQMTSFSKREFFDFFSQTQDRLVSSDARISQFCELAKLEQFPDLKTLYTQIDSPFQKLIKIRGKRSGIRFRAWMQNHAENSAEVEEITKAYVDAIVDAKGFFQTTAGKITKTVAMSSIGAGVGAMVGGVPGSIMGLSAAKILEPAADLGLDLVDQFVLDGLMKGWTPRIFFDDLRKVKSAEHHSSSK